MQNGVKISAFLNHVDGIFFLIGWKWLLAGLESEPIVEIWWKSWQTSTEYTSGFRHWAFSCALQDQETTLYAFSEVSKWETNELHTNRRQGETWSCSKIEYCNPTRPDPTGRVPARGGEGSGKFCDVRGGSDGFKIWTGRVGRVRNSNGSGRAGIRYLRVWSRVEHACIFLCIRYFQLVSLKSGRDGIVAECIAPSVQLKKHI